MCYQLLSRLWVTAVRLWATQAACRCLSAALLWLFIKDLLPTQSYQDAIYRGINVCCEQIDSTRFISKQFEFTRLISNLLQICERVSDVLRDLCFIAEHAALFAQNNNTIIRSNLHLKTTNHRWVKNEPQASGVAMDFFTTLTWGRADDNGNNNLF